jgi:type II secretory ATPase GspE/PulE/Tfp pilus assembly ATPase PilB-like protein
MVQDIRRDEETTTQKRARLIGMAYFDTSVGTNKTVFKDILQNSEIESLRIVPLQVDRSNILFGVTTSTSQQTMKSLQQRFTDQRVTFAIISDAGFHEYIHLYNPPAKINYENISLSTESKSDLVQRVSTSLQIVRPDDVLAYLVQQAYNLKGSDIHLESQRNGIRVRFRVDGVLHTIANLTREKYHQLLSSIAIAANVSSNSPDAQAGHINSTYKMATGEEVTLNLRVETVPTAYGMDVVMRLFTLSLEVLNLEKLGLSDREKKVVDDIIEHPSGMVLVVGPTGSGKTTTMYSLINTLNNDERKIITLEDPIEYFLDGVIQIPVQSDKQEFSFAERLRAVLRLDPDVLMIGEIRDADTARTALQAALTGHLVMSTFHAYSASAALTRMLDFVGINPLFASAIRLIMSQRLVRRLDESSKQAYQADEGMKGQISQILNTLPPNVERPKIDQLTLYKAVPTNENPFGYKGQMAIREQLLMSPGVQQILRLPTNQVTTEMIEAKAIEDGMLTMLQDGVLKAIAGQTTLEEVFRVVG